MLLMQVALTVYYHALLSSLLMPLQGNGECCAGA